MLEMFTYPRTRDLDAGVRSAINRTAAIVEHYHGWSMNRRLNGDVLKQAEYAARASNFENALARLEEYADAHGLLVRCCTSGEDCYHEAAS